MMIFGDKHTVPSGLELSDSPEVISTGEQVEQFLLDNGDLFEASLYAWRDAFAIEDTPINLHELLQGQKHIGDNRQTRRIVDKHSRDLAETLRQVAHNGTQEVVVRFLSSQSQEYLFGVGFPEPASFITYAQEVMAKAIANVDEGGSGINYHFTGSTTEASVDPINRMMFKRLNELIPHYSLAQTYTALATARMQRLIADPDAAEVFLDRVRDIIAHGKLAPEFPGLLEILATNYKEAGPDSVIARALDVVEHDEHAYTLQFLESIINPEIRLTAERSKEVAAAYGVLASVARLFETAEVMTPDTFIQKYADHTELWSPELSDARAQYIASQKALLSSEIREGLVPYVRARRMTTSLTPSSTIRNAGEHFVVGRGSSRKTKIEVKDKRIKGSIPEKEPTRVEISSFAVLKGVGSKSASIRLEPVDSLDDLLASPIVADYVARYPHEQSLADDIQRSIDHIRTNPFDRTASRVMVGFQFRLQNDISDKKRTPYKLRRFRPDSLVGVHGDIARQTRIMYEILTVNGVPTLALYMIENKKNVANFGKNANLKR